ncbi:RNase P modulator RnpM [Chloroflexota bacterium]
MKKKMSTKQRSAIKHIPQRSCVACHQAKTKRELIRLVRTSDGRVEVDTSGRRAGRGTYLCRALECWEIGLKGNRLQHALRTDLTQNNREQLFQCGKDLLQGVS